MQNRFSELDALRGIAAILVVAFHITLSHPVAQLGFKIGVTGVDLFFLISGFVIFMSVNKLKSGREFIINRFSRLYPTYWVSVIISFVLIATINWSNGVELESFHLKNFFANLTMFQHYLRHPDLDEAYWTMIIEMVFYITILVLFKFKLLNYLSLIGISMSIIAVSIAHFINNTELKKMILLGIPLLQFMPLFLAGTIFYKLQNNQTNKYVAYFTLLSCFILQLMLFEHVGASRIFINKWEYFLALGSYFIIFFLAVRNRLKFIINPISLFLGKISFALYLIHFNISRKLLLPLFHEKLDINFFVASIITIFIVVGFASCITYMVEIPMQKKLKAKLSCLIIK